MRLKCKFFFWIKNNLFNKIHKKNIKVSRVTLRRKFSSVASTSSSRQDITIYHYTDYNRKKSFHLNIRPNFFFYPFEIGNMKGEFDVLREIIDLNESICNSTSIL